MGAMMSAEENQTEETEVDAAERGLWFWLALILCVNVAGLIWLAVRADSPQSVRGILDIMLHSAMGAAVTYLAFRALLRFPFRFPDLLIMVTVLSLGMKATVDFVRGLAALGIVSTDLASGERFGEIFQLCLWSGSVLVAGAAFGLRHCTLLKIDRLIPRAVCLIAGMLALPAAAGVTVFPIMMIRELLLQHVDVSRLMWLLLESIGSLAATIINSRNFMQTLTLNTEVGAKEKMPQ
jgi:hypothetical protein